MASTSVAVAVSPAVRTPDKIVAPLFSRTSLWSANGTGALSVPSFPILNQSTAFTIIQDIKVPVGNAASSYILANYKAGTTRGYRYYVTSAGLLELWLKRTGQAMQVRGSISLETGQWVRAAITYDGGGNNNAAGVKQFVEGVEDTSLTIVQNDLASNITPALTPNIMGWTVGSAEASYGTMVVYGRALTPGEIANVGPASKRFDHRAGPYNAYLDAGWNPDDLSGTTIVDFSGNGRTATMAGGMVNGNQALDSPHFYTPPSNHTDLIAWFRSDRGLTITPTKVSAWQGSAGRNLPMSNGVDVQRPLYEESIASLNGFPGLNYNALSMRLNIIPNEALDGSHEFTCFYVVDSGAGPDKQLLYRYNVGSLIRLTSTNVPYEPAINDDTAQLKCGAAAISGAQYQIVTGVPGTSLIRWRRNGAQIGTNNSYDGTMFTANTALLFGGLGQPIGKIVEWGWYDSELTGLDLTDLEDYLAARYAI